MDVIDLAPEHYDVFACCLEDWSDEAKEGAPRRAAWVARMADQGLRAKLAVDDDGVVGGMIQYLPIERTWVEGEGLYFVPCTWVHGYRKGRGDRRKRGLGRALLEAAEADARSLGATGMAAWGLWLPIWMRASWYRKHGYRRADRQGMAVLVWKPFTPEALPPRWSRAPLRLPEPVPGTVQVVAFATGWCMALNMGIERALAAAAELGDAVDVRVMDTTDPAVVAAWGRRGDALYVDGREVTLGPPPSYEKIHGILAKRVKRLARAGR
ncbi:MAG: GNAT family N-acetyltransferase [Deltaproteobacteria bacterium]|nr:GNAT family N-acetyltransferase [Deltaproteobacteria bacterium]